MARRELADCDRCKAKNVGLDGRVDLTGPGGETKGVYRDLCHACAAGILSHLAAHDHRVAVTIAKLVDPVDKPSS